MEEMTGPIDGVNKVFSVSEPYLNLLLHYNGVLLQPNNTNFPYSLNPGSTQITLGSGFVAPTAGDGLIAFFATSAAPSELIQGDFPSIVVTALGTPQFSVESLVPVITKTVGEDC